jgi:hypothetical protein
MDDWTSWEDYKRKRWDMLARHEHERNEMFYRQREESEALTRDWMDNRAARSSGR